ncbi:MAG TPA: GNAT family N-acetyltransferase [Steroidobacteraceae bacterium]|jgi:ribosomal protein S18 acetylase RimI-like enzyme|nr:GNAT family N-acetyltransferase [Steroidobacteraceae bacterium]
MAAGATIIQAWPEDLSAFENPVWSALTAGPHRDWAGRFSDTAWYPGAVAPFVAIPHHDVVPHLDEARERGMGTQAYFVGVLPRELPRGWRVTAYSFILQLFPTEATWAEAEEAGVVLEETHRPAMRSLMQAAFPDYFRERTAELGTYVGVFEGRRLIAMAGERIAIPGWQEVSAVCTHPDFARRGHARRLTLAVMVHQRRRGTGSFLHTSEGNIAGRALYRSMHFVERAPIAHIKVERAAS